MPMTCWNVLAGASIGSINGAMAAAARARADEYSSTPSVGVYIFCAVAVMFLLLSSVYHLRVCKKFIAPPTKDLDISSISVLMTFSFFTSAYYWVSRDSLYFIITAIMGAAIVCGVIVDSSLAPKWRFIREVIFSGLALSGPVPFLHIMTSTPHCWLPRLACPDDMFMGLVSSMGAVATLMRACLHGTEWEQVLQAVCKLQAEAAAVDAKVSSDYLVQLGYNWKHSASAPERRAQPLSGDSRNAIKWLILQLVSPAPSIQNQPAAQALSPEQSRKTAAAISRLQVRGKDTRLLCEVLASNVVQRGQAAEPGGLREWGLKEWAELLYGLANAGGTCSQCPSLAELLNRALYPEVLPHLLHEGPEEGKAVSISNVFQAYAKAGAPHTALLQELAGAVRGNAGVLMRNAPRRSRALLRWAWKKLGV